MTFNRTPLNSVESGLGDLESTNSFEFLSISNFDPTQGWTLEGTLSVPSGANEAPRIEIQVSDVSIDNQLSAGTNTLFVFGNTLTTDTNTLAGNVEVSSTLEFDQDTD